MYALDQILPAHEPALEVQFQSTHTTHKQALMIKVLIFIL